jgi:large subunit ribosomal protein L18
MSAHKLFERRKERTRRKLRSQGRIRLSVYRSKQHIYAQIIDDEKQITLAHAATTEKEVANKLKNLTSNIAAAKEVGALIADRAKKANVETVVFDRGGYLYHGRVKALAEAARENGLLF